MKKIVWAGAGLMLLSGSISGQPIVRLDIDLRVPSGPIITQKQVRWNMESGIPVLELEVGASRIIENVRFLTRSDYSNCGSDPRLDVEWRSPFAMFCASSLSESGDEITSLGISGLTITPNDQYGAEVINAATVVQEVKIEALGGSTVFNETTHHEVGSRLGMNYEWDSSWPEPNLTSFSRIDPGIYDLSEHWHPVGSVKPGDKLEITNIVTVCSQCRMSLDGIYRKTSVITNVPIIPSVCTFDTSAGRYITPTTYTRSGANSTVETPVTLTINCTDDTTVRVMTYSGDGSVGEGYLQGDSGNVLPCKAYLKGTDGDEVGGKTHQVKSGSNALEFTLSQSRYCGEPVRVGEHVAASRVLHIQYE